MTAPTVAPAVAPAVPPVTAPGGAPSGSRQRWLRTPGLVRAAMVAVLVPVVLFALAVEVGVSRMERTMETIGQDATRGITVAQDIRVNVAQLDTTVVQSLLAGVDASALGESGYPEAYNTARRDLQDNLVVAASGVTDPAYQQYLVNIDYALGHYHALVRASFAASAAGDTTQALADYRAAHAVVAETMSSQADGFDKANTYVLNQAYDRHATEDGESMGWIVVSGVFLMSFLVVVQLVAAWRFRRMVNLPLLAATLLVVVAMIFTVNRLDQSSDHLDQARTDAFDAVHTLARARASTAAAHQAEALLVLDPADPATAQATFEAQTVKLFRIPDEFAEVAEVAAIAESGDVPVGAGGYLAAVVDGGAEDTATEFTATREARQALEAFGIFLETGEEIQEDVEAGRTEEARARFDQGTHVDNLNEAIDRAQGTYQRIFDARVEVAADSLGPVDLLGFVGAGAALVLTLLGLYPRLREYR